MRISDWSSDVCSSDLPALGSVGACRQCAVKSYRDESDKTGRIVMSCMTPASNGTFISIADEEAKDFRASVVEFLMTNHPHDCPACEDGGHCHLQDMTVMTAPQLRPYRFDKRTHLNQIGKAACRERCDQEG